MKFGVWQIITYFLLGRIDRRGNRGRVRKPRRVAAIGRCLRRCFFGDGPVVGWCFWCAQELIEAVFVEDGDVAAGIFEVIDLVLFAAAGAFRPEDEVVDVV